MRQVLLLGHNGDGEGGIQGTCPRAPNWLFPVGFWVHLCLKQQSGPGELLWTDCSPTSPAICCLWPLTTFLLGLPAGHLFREAGREAEKLDKKAGTWLQVGKGQKSQVWWQWICLTINMSKIGYSSLQSFTRSLKTRSCWGSERPMTFSEPH